MNQKLQNLLTNIELRELLSKSSIDAFLRISGKVISYIFIYFFIHWLGIRKYGLWSFAFSLFSFFSLLAGLGFKTSIVKYYTQSKSEKIAFKSVYFKMLKMLAISSLIMAVLLFVLAQKLADYADKEQAATAILFFAFSVVPINILRLNSGLLKAMRKTAFFGFFEHLGSTLFLVIIMVVLNSNKNLSFNDTLMAFVISSFLLMLLSYIPIFNSLRINGVQSKKSPSYKTILQESFPMFLTNSSSMIKNWTDVIILGFFCGPAIVGGYNVLIKISRLIIIPLQSVNTVSVSKISEYFDNRDFNKIKKLVMSSTKIIVLITVPSMLIVAIFKSYILQVFDNRLLQTNYALYILLAGQFINAITGSVSQTLNMTQHQGINMRISLFTAFLNILLNIILIPVFNIYGAAAATAFTLALQNIWSSYYVRKYFGFWPIYLPWPNLKSK